MNQNEGTPQEPNFFADPSHQPDDILERNYREIKALLEGEAIESPSINWDSVALDSRPNQADLAMFESELRRRGKL